MNDLERFRTTSPLPAIGHELFGTGTNSKDVTLQVVLFKALMGYSKQSKSMNMLYNLQAAAFHLSFMLKGYTANEKLVSILWFREEYILTGIQEIPNIPDTFDSFDDV